ncbi:MAG: hypothetical protein AAFP90_00130 [Planctomycetota bacterium]
MSDHRLKHSQPEIARRHFITVCRSLEENPDAISDEEILLAHRSLVLQIQTNCHSAAEGLFMMAASVCSVRPALELAVLPDAFRPLYYMGVEEIETIRSYLVWLADECDDPYLLQTDDQGRDYLRSLSARDAVLLDAFRKMYDAEENGWRIGDDDVPDMLRVLDFRVG